MLIGWIATWSRRLVAVFLVLVVAWHVSNAATPRRGRAVIRMGKLHDLVVSIDQLDHVISSSFGTPMTCELEAGTHLARVWHRGWLVSESSFKVEPGRVVLIDPIPNPVLRRIEETTIRPAPGSPSLQGHGLAARTRGPADATLPN